MKSHRKIIIILLFYFLMTHVCFADDFSHLKNLHAPGCDENGKPKWIKCPDWDWNLIPSECKTPHMIAINCLPKCGKYLGDKPDIGAWEDYPGITCQKPWGDWNGIPDLGKPNLIKPPKNFRLQ